LPLNHNVIYKTVLQKRGRLQVPKLIRWKYKLEPTEVLKVTVTVEGALGVRESFLATVHKDGRLVIPKLTMALLKCNEPSLEGCAMEVTLEPT
jgi:bifunctional DNA-binding transcriptional regulator/antitoxin component of YhaV-PrlF toxin-antitoxin module